MGIAYLVGMRRSPSNFYTFRAIFRQHLISFILIYNLTADIVGWSTCLLEVILMLSMSLNSGEPFSNSLCRFTDAVQGRHFSNIFLIEYGSLYTAVAILYSISMISKSHCLLT